MNTEPKFVSIELVHATEKEVNASIKSKESITTLSFAAKPESVGNKVISTNIGDETIIGS